MVGGAELIVIENSEPASPANSPESTNAQIVYDLEYAGWNLEKINLPKSPADGPRGKYVVLFFYPLDFTFVCPSEIIAFDKALPEFEERNSQVIGVSVDSHFTHLAWKNTPRDQGGIGQVGYPLVADLSKQIARRY